MVAHSMDSLSTHISYRKNSFTQKHQTPIFNRTIGHRHKHQTLQIKKKINSLYKIKSRKTIK